MVNFFNFKMGNFLIAIRAYNEAKNLPILIEKIIKEGYKEILVVDDCSTDNTKEIVENLIKRFPNVKIYYVKHIKNGNMGCGLLTELKFAQRLGKNLITLDGDLQHDPKDIIKFVEKLEEGYDIVFGNRYKGKTYNLPLYRRILHFLNFLFNFILSQKKLEDIHNGFRGYNKKVLKLFEENLVYFDGSYADNVFYITVKFNLRYCDVPVEIKYSKESLKKGQKVYKTFLKILLKSFFLRFFRFKSWNKIILLSFFVSFLLTLLFSVLSIFLFNLSLNFDFFIFFSLFFLIIFGIIFYFLFSWSLVIKKDKELKEIISEESIKQFFIK